MSGRDALEGRLAVSAQHPDRVSIITPAYKAAGYVEETIRSVLAQTHQDWELLIADDCSPDDTRAVVQRWAEQDPRIRLIALERNGGPAAARNAALAQASGRWVAFLDSDDLWLPTKLERAIGAARASGAALVFTGFRRITADSKTVGRYIGVPTTLTYRQLLGNTAIATSTVLLDRQQTGEVRMRKTYYDDFDCWLQLLKRGLGAVGVDEDLMRYRVMQQSVSRNKKRSAMHVWRAYRELEGLGPIGATWYFANYGLRAWWKYRRF
jgi:teichuronic acid biosynthesis glycosyltransferase TuaG